MKKCPYCAEEIQDAAIVCRYCGRDLNPINPPTQPRQVRSPANPPIQPEPVRKKGEGVRNFGIGTTTLFCLLCVVVGAIANLGRNVSSTQTAISGNVPSAQTATAPSVTKGADSITFATWTLTSIPLLTDTPLPTSTPQASPTQTLTQTPAFTLEPATQTSIARNQTATQRAENSTATRSAVNANATGTTNARTIRATGTAQAKSERATLIAQYLNIDVNQFVSYPETYTGVSLVIRGRVFNINSNKEFQIWIDNASYEAAYIVMTQPYTDIFKGDHVTIYGTGYGKNCGTNTFGGKVCQPIVMGEFYEKK